VNIPNISTKLEFCYFNPLYEMDGKQYPNGDRGTLNVSEWSPAWTNFNYVLQVGMCICGLWWAK